MTRLDERPWPSIPTGGLVIVPLGSTEQHGPHLPFTVDALVASAVAAAVADALAEPAGAVLAPALPYGSSGEHQQFAGTLSIGGRALSAVLVELVRSAAAWAGRMLFVSGHGGNAAVLSETVPRMRGEQHDVAWAPCIPPALPGVTPDAHAGRIETSLMLHLAPAVVGAVDDVTGSTVSLGEAMPALAAGRLRELSPSGVLGRPAGASAAEGAALLAGMTDELVRKVDAWRVGSDGRLGAA